MSVVKVKAGSCGFVTCIKAAKENRREVRLSVESDCASVCDLGFILEELGSLAMKDVISTHQAKNQVLRAAAETLPHSACPVPVALLKAAEVALGLNIPKSVTIEFQDDCES